ncbi:1993_t:CDS:1, partial [Scutellospora calospora]
MEYSCYCYEKYYKHRVYDNVKSFLKRLEKGPNILITEEKKDLEKTLNEDDNIVEEVDLNKTQDMHVAFLKAINQ